MIPEWLGQAADLIRKRAEAINALTEVDGGKQAELQQQRHGGGRVFREHFAPWSPRVALALAAWLEREERLWQEDWESHWAITASAWDKNNQQPMTTEQHQHFRDIACEFADGRHRPAVNFAIAYLSEEPA